MNLKRQNFKIAAGVFLSLLMALACPIYGEDAPQSVTIDVKDLVDGHWLPDIVGLPDEEQVESLTSHVADVMAEEQDKKCNAIDYNLRLLVFQNFVIFQQMVNAQNHY